MTDAACKAMVGARSELLVCCDLMARGYYVYRAESPAAPWDLVAYRRENPCRALRIEVRTGTRNPSTGNLSVSLKETDMFDIFAIVCSVGDGYQVGYLPDGVIEETEFPFLMTDSTIERICAHAAKVGTATGWREVLHRSTIDLIYIPDEEWRRRTSVDPKAASIMKKIGFE